jgi:hypothetical protein
MTGTGWDRFLSCSPSIRDAWGKWRSPLWAQSVRPTLLALVSLAWLVLGWLRSPPSPL